MARTKETKMSPEQQEKMTQEVVASLQSSTYGKDYAQEHSSFFEEVENSDLEVVTENVAATTSCMEDEPTNEALSPPNPQKRISGKQRKATLEEYQQTFLQVPRIDDRKPVFVSSDVRDRLDRVVRILGGRRMSVSGIIENKKKLGKLKPTDFLVKTIVTTEVIAEIAKKNNVELRDCYTGFKWIAREIAISEGKQQYIGGGEESFGFLPYDKVRDKDAPASICLICEIAAWAKDQGKTLYDLLMQIYAEYGFSKEFTVNVVRPGKTGADEIKQMMTDFRANPPKELGGSKIVTWKDYQSLEAKHADGSVEKLDMPTTSNVLQWFCDDNTKVSVRPSGTEPKIKFYIEVKDPSFKCAGCYNRCTAAAMDKIEAIKKSLKLD